MDYKTCGSLPAMFFGEAERFGDRPFLWAKRGGSYRPISWREALTTSSPSSTAATSGALVMKSTSSPKNGRSLCSS